MRRKRFVMLCLIMGLAMILSGCFGKSYVIKGQVVDVDGNGIPNVTLVTTGKTNSKVQTQANGSFEITVKGKVTVTPALTGYGFQPASRIFEEAPQQLVVFTGGEGAQPTSLKVDVIGQGTVTIYPKEDFYVTGARVTLTPNPNETTVFSHWAGDLVSEESPTTITMNRGKNISAVFVDSSKVIDFTDFYLEKAVRETIDKPVGLIVTDDVAALESLDASIEKIKALGGIEKLNNLKELIASKATIEDISPLADLTQMQKLDLSYNKIDNLVALGKLINLEELNLANNKISRINNMIWFSYKKLKTLDLGGNMISDYASLYRMTNLERLILNDNQITTILPLTELAKAQSTPMLKEVDLSGNKIAKLENGSYLQNLIHLEKLDLSRNQLADIGSLVWLQKTNLVDLNLSENPLSSLKPLSSMSDLETLDLSKTGLSDLSALSELTALKVLKLNDNQITDLTPLAKLPLEKLHLHNNQLEDISPLLELTDTLKEITLMGNDDLNLSTGYEAYQVIEALRNAGVMVRYSFYKNDVPILEKVGNRVINETELLEFTLNATDPDGDEIIYEVTGDLVDFFDMNTLTFTWTPTYDDAGVYTMTFKVSDGEADVSETITITVNNVNRAPVLEPIGPQEIMEQNTLTFTAKATDPDGENLTYSATSDDSRLVDAFNTNTRTFTWKPGWFDAGVYTMTISVTDGDLTASETIEITVTNNNRTPVLDAIGNKTVQETNLLEFTIFATDADNETITYSVSGDLTQYFDEATGKFSWTPTYADAGEYYITFYASDGDLFAEEQVKITVENLDRLPVWDTPIPSPQTHDERSEIIIQIAPLVSDPDDDEFEYSFTTTHPSIMNSATMDKTSGEFRWIPVQEDTVGVRTITFKAMANGVTISQTVEFSITDRDFPPNILQIVPLSVDENQEHAILVDAEEWDGEEMIFSATGTIAANFTLNNNVFTWTPSYDDAGTYPTTFTVTDINGNPTSRTVDIVVNNVNRLPAFANPAEYVVEEDTLLTFTVTVTDPDGDLVNLSATSPTGIHSYFNSTTRQFSWRPGFNDAGTHTIVFYANDGADETTYPITIKVSNKDRAPIWSTNNKWGTGSTITGHEYSPISFALNATDPDGDPITYTLVSTPSMNGATLDPTTGVFNWTPTEADISEGFALGYYEVTFKAKSGTAETTKDIMFYVNDVEFPPVLEPIGNQTVNEGDELRFSVLATDKDTGQLISYLVSCVSHPSYDPVADNPNIITTFDMLLDRNTNEFVWTPDFNQQGTYELEILAWNPSTGGQDKERIYITVQNAPQFVFSPAIDITQLQTIDVDSITSSYSLNVTTSDPVIDNVTNITASGSGITTGGAQFTYNSTTKTGTLQWSKTNLKNHVNEDFNIVFTITANGTQFTKEVLFHVSGKKLGVNSLTLSNTTATVNTEIYADLTIQNTGDKDIGTSFDITWARQKWDGIQWVTLSSLTTDTVPSLTAGSTFTVPTKVFIGGTSEGTYRLYVEVDPTGAAAGKVTGSATYTVEPPKYLLTTSTSGTGAGIVTKSPSGTTYTSGTTVTLTATPDPGSYFVGWSANVTPSGTNPLVGTVTITNDTIVTAQFDQISLPKKFVYVSTKSPGTNGEIYLMYQDGTVNQLTYNNLRKMNYRWSNDGRYISYEADSAGTSQVYLIDVAGGTERQLTFTGGEEPAVAPAFSYYDGKVAYVKLINNIKQIMLLDILNTDQSGTLTRLTSTGSNTTNPAWSPVPSDNALVYVMDGHLYLHRKDKSDDDALTEYHIPAGAKKPTWSADGRTILFEANGNIYVVEFSQTLGLNSWDVYLVTQGSNPVWMQGSSSIFYYEQGGVIKSATKVSGTFSGALVEDVFYDSYTSGLTVTSSGEIIYVYGATSSGNELYYKPNATAAPIPLTNNSVNDYLPKWAP